MNVPVNCKITVGSQTFRGGDVIPADVKLSPDHRAKIEQAEKDLGIEKKPIAKKTAKNKESEVK